VSVADEAEALRLQGAELWQHYSAVGCLTDSPQLAREVGELFIGGRAVHAADFAALHAMLDGLGAVRIALEDEHVAHVTIAYMARAPVPTVVHRRLHVPRDSACRLWGTNSSKSAYSDFIK
jgi:hypothetical protein